MSNEQKQPVGSSEWLGPLPEADMRHLKALDDRDEETSYSAELMEAERQRCYELGVAAERKQWKYAVHNALHGKRGLEELLHRPKREDSGEQR